MFGSGAAAPSGGSGFKFGVAPSTTPSTASTESVGSGFKFGDSSKSGSGFQFGSSSNESGFKLGAEKKVESEKSESEDSNKEYPKEFLTQLKALNTDVSELLKESVDSKKSKALASFTRKMSGIRIVSYASPGHLISGPFEIRTGYFSN